MGNSLLTAEPVLPVAFLRSILTKHGVQVKDEKNSLFALEVWTLNFEPFEAWVNVTQFTKKDLLTFLNY